MRRLRRTNIQRPPDTWAGSVIAAFADHAAYLEAARTFEQLPINSVERRAGFCAYVQQQGVPCFRVGRSGKIEFKSLWGQSKEAIAGMSFYKCAYCEGEVNASRAGQVEHFKPKTIFPMLAYEWDNYFLGCAGCNGAKSNKWPARGGYLRPDEGAPENELLFENEGTVTATRARGRETLRDFDLNRTWLVRWRRLHIQAMLEGLTGLLEVYATDASLGRRLIETYLSRLSLPGQIYSVALSQCAAREWSAARGR